MEVKVDYYKNVNSKPEYSHSYDQEVEPTEYYCPHCGKQGMWVCDGDDYYVGRRFLCPKCCGSACLDNGGPKSNETDMQLIKAIRKARQ